MSIHATFKTFAFIVVGLLQNRSRPFLSALLISMFWTGMPDTSEAGYWTAPSCNGQDFPVDGDTVAAGVDSARQRKVCTAPNAKFSGQKRTQTRQKPA